MSKRVNAHIFQTKKELDKQRQELITSSKTVSASISEQKGETEPTVAHLKLEVNQNRLCIYSVINWIIM